MSTMQKIVIKVGSSTLTQGTQKLSRRHMLSLTQQIAYLKNQNVQLILVSSGAVSTGRELFEATGNLSIPSRPMLASIGQVKLMQVWSELFSLFDIQIGQVLVTKNDFLNQNQNITQDTLTSLLQHNIIPIVNENDPVASGESRIGDNDNLAALTAKFVGADMIILLTDQEGLFTADPRYNAEAKLIPIVSKIDENIFALAGGFSTALGTGGMKTKIEAAQVAAKYGIRTVIASSYQPNILIDIAEGKSRGTLFLEDSPKQIQITK